MPRDKPATRDEFVCFYPILTRWADNDALGHVNNAHYFSYFDTAVTQFLGELALLHPIEGARVFVVAEAGCRYLREVAFPDRLEVGLRIERVGSSAVTYALGLFREGETEVSAEGHFVHVLVDRAGKRADGARRGGPAGVGEG